MYDVLITGGTGFIGSNLIKNLKNRKILLVSRRKIRIRNKLVKILVYDNFSDLILKLDKIKTKNIVHCATHYVKSHRLADIEKIFEANILLGNVLLQNSKKMNVKKFVNLSTAWEINYDPSTNNLNLYTLSKKIFSEAVNFYSTKYKKIKFYNLYLLDTFGEGDKRTKILTEIKKKLNNNKKILIESKYLTMNFLNVKDVIEAIKLVINKNYFKKKNYVVCNTKKFKIKKIIEKFNYLSEKKIKYKFLNTKIIDTKLPNITKLPYWKIRHSNISDIINYLKN